MSVSPSVSVSASLDHCIDSLYMTLGDEGRLPATASALRSLFNAGAACIFTVDSSARVLSFGADNISQEHQQRWVDHYSDVDPMRPFALASKPGQWMTNDDLLHPDRSPSPEYVHDFARFAGIRWFSGGKVAEDHHGSSFFTLQRPHDKKPFDQQTIALLDALLPHMRRVARLRMELSAGLDAMSSSSPSSLSSSALSPAPVPVLWAARPFDPYGALDALAVGVCIVRLDSSIKFVNKAGEALLARKGFAHRPGAAGLRLELESPVANSQLRQALSMACKRPRKASAFSVPLPPAPNTRLQLRVLPAAGPAAGHAEGPFDALVFFSAGPPQLRSDVLEQLHDLTGAEAELVSLLAQGLSPQACAQSRGVSVSTVRAQLSSILAKTGAATQSQLLSTVLAMPALP